MRAIWFLAGILLVLLCCCFSPLVSALEEPAGESSAAKAAPHSDAPARAEAAADSAGASGRTGDANRPVKDKWALIVGISEFQDPAINLKHPAKDASDFRDYLVGAGRFAPDHVKLLLNTEATRERILDALGDKWLPRAAGPDDLVVIYISSHGSPASLDIGGVNYILAHDTDKERLYSTGIAMQDLARIIKNRIHSDRVVVILDACHSGAAGSDSKGLYRQGNFDAEDLVQGTGQMVICSSEPNQISWESLRQDNSVFTRHLLNGLKMHGDKTTLSQCFQHMREQVEEEVRRDRGVMQTPVLRSKWSGNDLVLAAAPVRPGPGLPAPPVAAAAAAPVPAGARTVAPTAGCAVAIMSISGPIKVDSDRSLGFIVRSGGAEAPDEAALSGLGDALALSMKEKLETVLKEKVLAPGEVKALLAQGGSAGKTEGTSYWTGIAAKLGARFLIVGTIEEASFEGHTLSGDIFEMTASARLISGDTGQTLARINRHTVSKRLWSGSQKDPTACFYDALVPSFAGFVVNRFSKALRQ